MNKKIKTDKIKKVVILYGELTGLDAIELFKILEKFNKEKREEIILDLSNVEYMDSNCLGALIYSQIVLNKNNKKLIISAPRELVATLFRDCSFDNVFEIIESYE